MWAVMILNRMKWPWPTPPKPVGVCMAEIGLDGQLLQCKECKEYYLAKAWAEGQGIRIGG